jgi:hypothetical protein
MPWVSRATAIWPDNEHVANGEGNVNNAAIQLVRNATKRTLKNRQLPYPVSSLNERSLLSLDRIERGHELCPSFVDLKELPSRLANWEWDEEAAAQAGHLRMTAKPTDGLLVRLAAVRAAYLDLGIVKRTFGDDASSRKGKGE